MNVKNIHVWLNEWLLIEMEGLIAPYTMNAVDLSFVANMQTPWPASKNVGLAKRVNY